jgi:hypothetical protein
MSRCPSPRAPGTAAGQDLPSRPELGRHPPRRDPPPKDIGPGPPTPPPPPPHRSERAGLNARPRWSGPRDLTTGPGGVVSGPSTPNPTSVTPSTRWAGRGRSLSEPARGGDRMDALASCPPLRVHRSESCCIGWAALSVLTLVVIGNRGGVLRHPLLPYLTGRTEAAELDMVPLDPEAGLLL